MRLITCTGAAPRVLVAEDGALVAGEIDRMLREVGCDPVGPFATLEQTLRAAHGERLDAALLDVNLADGEAFAAAEVLLQREVPLAFLTGYAAAALPEGYRGLPCLEKPFQSSDLLHLLTSMGLASARQ